MLNTVTVTWNEQDIGEGALAGSVTFQLSAVAADQADGIDIHPAPAKTYFFVSGTGSSGPLVANDNAGLLPAGGYYKVTVAISGQQPYTFTTLINYSAGASQTLAQLYANQAVPAAQYSQFLPLTTGAPTAGEVPVFTGVGYATTPGAGGGGGSGTVSSVNEIDPDDSGNVTLAASDVGAASTGALASEATTRADADALLIPLTQKGAASGVATLDSGEHVPAAQLPAATITTRGAAILSPGAMPWQFYCPALGGGDDDVPNLLTALSSAASYMAANQGYAELWVDPALYTLASALTHSGLGNAQLPLPVSATSVTSGILVIRCTSSNGAQNPMFGQTAVQASGAVFRSTLTGQSVDGTYGYPCILGGPVDGYGYASGVYDNLNVIIDGITFQPQWEASGPTMAGAFLANMAKAQIVSGAYMPQTTVAAMTATQPANFWAVGAYLPYPLNNDNEVIGSWSAYGAYHGLVATSHLSALRVQGIYCNNAVTAVLDSDGHGVFIGNLSAELCTNALLNGGSSGLTPIAIGLLDCESIGHYATGYHISDSGNFLSGSVLVNDISGTVSVNGAANVEIINARQPRSVQSAPSYTLGTAFQNPWWRHATVTLAGGTVTGISIGPTSGSLTSLGITAGTFRLPSGWWLEIAGSGKPTTFIAALD